MIYHFYIHTNIYTHVYLQNWLYIKLKIYN